ncbi:hypothetical protein [Phaeobacter gallaeciensis]|uniref:hypothetical protein n=1 Tax=Phaeobacter gallaeciensis TaxID=60890 RepID=UPI000BBBE4A3|nr:hypothetical protein [Phaeobacter gallaeciensis]ATF17183.1 hypothetical protein PhaeoP129_00523 [Phaeobacter gallaeciensis]ATF21292.1 hypothetical protein PhaeoP128_00523 [Phaeobacter gallaeciensis]
MGGDPSYPSPFVLLKWALGIAGIAIAFPAAASVLANIEVEWVRTIGLRIGFAAYFGSFLMLALSGVLAVWLGLTFVLNRFAGLDD